GGQRLRTWMVPGHQRPRLDVKHETRRRALGPAPHGEDVGDRVVRRVHLDHIEDRGVEAQARLRRHRFLRIEAARLDEGGVRPWPAPPPSLVAPTTASPVLMPMCSATGGKTPPYSSFSVAVRCRMAKAARVALRAWSCEAAGRSTAEASLRWSAAPRSD